MTSDDVHRRDDERARKGYQVGLHRVALDVSE